MDISVAERVHKRANLGEYHYHLEGEDGYMFGSRESAKRRAEEHGVERPVIKLIDTRPTLREVAKQLQKLENERLGIDSKWSTGPWDEYFSAGTSGFDSGNAKWPHTYARLAVFVVQGGSEGLYLHVEIFNEGKHECILLGKTCDSSFEKWQECWESAGWIAYYLGA